MDVLVERCAGLDVHRDTVVATVRLPGDRGTRAQHTETFGTTMGELKDLARWLVNHEVTLAGMEATGVYWKPVFHVLEDHLECWVLNAQHLHNVPGRKTDVADSGWIAQLLEHGLVRPSFVPPLEIRELRDLTRLRKAQIDERTRAVQRLEKVLQDAGVKLTSVASQAFSKSARAMVEALIAGTTDPTVLANLAKGRLRSKIPQLQRALASRFRADHHGVLAAQLLAHIDVLDQAVSALDARIAERAAHLEALIELLCTIPGVARRTAEVLIAECGVDMGRFPSAAHLASWAGICPGNDQSGGTRRPGRTRRGSKWLRQALTEAAWAAARSRGTYFAAHHAQLRARLGGAKAVGATRHDILVAYYHVVRDGVPFRELGADWQARRHSVEHRTARLVRQLEALGHRVRLQPQGVA